MRITRFLAAALSLAFLVTAPVMAAPSKKSTKSGSPSVCTQASNAIQSIGGAKLGCSDKSQGGKGKSDSKKPDAKKKPPQTARS